MIDKTGSADWYEWAVKNWGTKWNAYETVYDEDDDPNTIRFETAWSPPEPWFRKLAETFPEITFCVSFIDEGWGFAGTETYRGTMIGDDPVECDKHELEFILLYEDVYGHAIPDDDDDD